MQEQSIQSNRWLKLNEVAALIGYSRSTVWRMVDSGELACVRYRGKIRIPAAVVEAWQRQHEQLAGIPDNASHE